MVLKPKEHINHLNLSIIAQVLAKPTLQSTDFADRIVKGMQDKKAIEIAVLDLRNIKNAFADYFIICSGNSDTQVDAVADSVEKAVYELTGQFPRYKEGKMNREWILLDYIDVVAHVFKKDKREYFGLEDLWGDADITYLED